MACLGVAAVVTLTVTAGCGQRRPLFARQTGYVDIDALVKASPGWSTVNQLSDDISTIAKSRKSVPVLGFDRDLANLPSIAALKTRGSSGLGSSEYQKLWRRANRDLELLAQRRQVSRDQQVERQSEGWSIAAEDQYNSAMSSIGLNYTQRVGQIYGEQRAERISLDLQIDQLNKTISNWAGSAPPPTPRLNAAKAQLAAKTAELKTIGDALHAKLEAAQNDRDEQQADAERQRESYVVTRVAAERERLEKIDRDHLAEERVRLAEQIRQLLTASASAERTSILKLEALTPYEETMNSVPVEPATDSEANAAIAGLVKQRNRRETFLYNAVRARALKIADEQHWTIEFVKNGSTKTDLTGKIAAIMATRSTD